MELSELDDVNSRIDSDDGDGLAGDLLCAVLKVKDGACQFVRKGGSSQRLLRQLPSDYTVYDVVVFTTRKGESQIAGSRNQGITNVEQVTEIEDTIDIRRKNDTNQRDFFLRLNESKSVSFNVEASAFGDIFYSRGAALRTHGSRRDNSLGAGAVAGIVIGVLAFAVFVNAAIWYVKKRRKKKRPKSRIDSETGVEIQAWRTNRIAAKRMSEPL